MNDVLAKEGFKTRYQQFVDEAAKLFEVFRNTPERSTIERWLGREITDGEYRDARVDYATLCCATQADGPLPYESVYKNEDRLLMGDCVDEVKLAYALIGYEIPDDLSREPEDHIAIELDYLSYAYIYAFAEDNVSEREELLDLVDSFKEEHFDSWARLYVDEGLSVVDGEFYRMVLERLCDFTRI